VKDSLRAFDFPLISFLSHETKTTQAKPVPARR